MVTVFESRGIRFVEKVIEHASSSSSATFRPKLEREGSCGDSSPSSSHSSLVFLSPSGSTSPSISRLVCFSFAAPRRRERLAYRHLHKQLLQAAQQSQFLNLSEGQLLSTREKGVSFPVVHFIDHCSSWSIPVGEHELGPDFIILQGLYREVRSIVPEFDSIATCHISNNPEALGYMLLGFNGHDHRNFSDVMVDTWKDWTGARWIYLYMPDCVGLTSIRLFRREAPSQPGAELFTFLVLVECRGERTRENQELLLDFAQRLRAERMPSYISVYQPANSGIDFNEDKPDPPPRKYRLPSTPTTAMPLV